jgi:hypothetical protein
LLEPPPDGTAVIGAVPAGAPVIVSCAATGVVDKKAQTAATDRIVEKKRFMVLAPMFQPMNDETRAWFSADS